MAGKHHVGVPVVENSPERLGIVGKIAVLSGAEARMVHVGEGASAAVGREISPQPPDLQRVTLAVAGHLLAVAVEGDDMPPAVVVAIIASVAFTRHLTEVVEVA